MKKYLIFGLIFILSTTIVLGAPSLDDIIHCYLFSASGEYTDDCGSGDTLTAGAGVSYQTTDKLTGQNGSLEFAGSSANNKLYSTSQTVPYEENMICAWFKQDSDNINHRGLGFGATPNGDRSLFACLDDTSNDDETWWGWYDGSATAVGIQYGNAEGTPPCASTNWFLTCYAQTSEGNIMFTNNNSVPFGSAYIASTNNNTNYGFSNITSAGNFNLGCDTGCTSQWWDGHIDDLTIWNTSGYTNEDYQTVANYVYNGGSSNCFYGDSCSGFSGGGSDPSLSLSSDITPGDKIGFLDFSNGVYLFNVSGSSANNSNIYNVDILINGTINKSFSNLDLSSTNELNWTFTDIEASINLTINASNENATDSISYDLYFDGINPAIGVSGITNNSIYYIGGSAQSFFFNSTFSDNNLLAVNVTMFNETGSKIYNFENQSVGVNSFIYSDTVDLTSNGTGNYSILFEAWDDHTKQDNIKPVNWITDESNIIIDDEITISGPIKPELTEFILSEDGSKYKFKITWEDDSLFHSMTIQTTEDLVYLPGSDYLGHFIYMNQKRWIDLVNPNIKDLQVTKINDQTYKIDLELYSTTDELEFESIGDLNYYSEGYDFAVEEGFSVYVIDTVSNTSVSSFTAFAYNDTVNQTVIGSGGVAVFNITGTYNVTISATNYVENTTPDLIFAQGSNTTIYLTPSNSLYFYFYDEQLDTIIRSNNITIEVINFDNESYQYNVNGSSFISGFEPGSYEIRYNSEGYNPRTYYTTIAGNDTQILRLYLLNSTVADYISFSIEDETGNYLENATVKATRFYTGCNCYRVVEMDKANFQGEAIFSLQKFDTRYNFIVEYNGLVVYSSSAGYKLTEDTYQLPVALLGDTTRSYFGTNQDVFSQLSYNNGTKLVTFTVSDSTNLVDHFCIYVDQMNALSDAGYQRICSNCLYATSGSVTCNITDYYGNGREILSRGFIETNTTYSSYWTDVLSIVTDTTGKAVTGTVGVFLSFLISFTVALIGFSIGGLQLAILGLDLGLVVSKMIGILDIGIAGLFAIIGVSIIIIYLIGERS